MSLQSGAHMNALHRSKRDTPGPSLCAECLAQIKTLCSLNGSDVLRLTIIREGPGVIEVPGQENPRVVIHAGQPIRVACRRGDDTHAGVTVYGDVDIVPAGVESRWETYGSCRALLLSVSQHLVDRIVESHGKNPAEMELHNRFKIRNPQIEHIGWALKAEFEQGCPNGRVFRESMATALAIEILRDRGLSIEREAATSSDLSSRTLKQLLAYIEDHLGEDLTLQAIASEMAMSVSFLKQYCRKSLGVPLHQYIMRQRVERAADLLVHRKLPISQVALETGFSHQSHLAKHMRRILGVSPNELRK